MCVMAKLSYENQLAIRSTGKVVQALDNLVSALRASGKVRFHGRKVTKEAVVNAIWLWLAELGPDEVEAALAVHMPRFEALLDSGELPAPGRGHAAMAVRVDVDTGKPINPKGKSKKTG